MKIKEVQNKEEFFILSEKLAGVFGSSAWLTSYGNNMKLIGIYSEDGEKLIGGFFYYNSKKGGFSFMKLPPYTPHCGLFFKNEAKNAAARNSFEKEVVTEVCNYIESQKKSLIVLAFPPYVKDMQPFIWNKYKVVPNYTYRILLNKSIEEIVDSFDPKNRNVINKAIKESVHVTETDRKQTDLFKYFSGTLKKAGANVYEKELSGIFNKFSNDSNSFSLSASKDNKLLGVVFCIYDSDKCYYILGGINKESEIKGINNLLILKSIEKAKELGCSVFDFEGSMLPGVEKFFRSFGPELIPYYTINKAILPLEIMLKFKKREHF